MSKDAPGGGTPFAGKDGKEETGGREAGGGRQVTRVIPNVTIGPDGGHQENQGSSHPRRIGLLLCKAVLISA